MAIFYFFIFLFGLVVGSFLNCLIYRLEIAFGRLAATGRDSSSSRSFLIGRSYCPYCKHILKWQDLVPVLSFFLLKRKCRYCQKPISWQYPLVELATGILFVLIASKFLFPITIYSLLITGYSLLVTAFLIVIFVYDLKHYIIPDKVIFPAIGIAFIYNIYQLAINNFLAALGAAAFFLVIVLISRGRWMGIGDIKLAFLMGLFLGWPNILVALFLAFLIGAVIGLGLIASGKRKLRSEVPFGPFLVTGTFIALFWGEQMFNWYLGFFLLK